MDVLEIATLVVAIAVNLLLLGFVYIRNPRSATHRLFILLILIMSIWSTTNFFAVNAQTPETAKWLVRSVMFFATPLSVVFFLLMYTFPRSTLPLSRRALWIWILLTLVTMAATISPLVFPIVDFTPGMAPSPQPGIGMILFVPISVGTIPLGIYFLIRKVRKARNIERVQFQFILLGVVIMFALIISLNFIAVILFRTSIFNRYGPLFTLPFTILTAYAMLRYRLMDIRAAIFRVLGFSVLLGGFFIIYGLFTYALTQYFTRIGLTPSQHALVAIGTIALAFPTFSYFRFGLSKLTDRFLFHNRVNYQKALVKLGEDLSGTIYIEQVTQIILRATREVIRSKKTVIFLQETGGGQLTPRAFEGVKRFSVTIPHNHVLLQHLRHAAGPLVRDELALFKERETSFTHAQELEKVENAFKWLDAAVILPLFVNKELTGVILLGDKLSGQPYLQDDVEFLAAFAPQAATALENARLYKESLEFGEKLEKEVRIATQELATANTQLKNLDKAKSEFLSIASHQLYTPLTALKGYLSMMIEGDYGPMPAKQKPIIDILQTSVTRLVTLIKDLLDISRIESGRLELNLESLDTVKMVDELVRDLMPNAIAKKLHLRFYPSDKPVKHVVGDAQRLRQVMLNMLDNAIKYTEAGRVEVRLEQQGEEAIFSVTDTGKGLTAEEITRLFNKFIRVGRATRYHTEGSGLGLYVAKQIVREHHGDIVAESPGTGKGSTFSVRLPVEGAQKSLKVRERASVVIKAAEAQGPGNDSEENSQSKKKLVNRS